jgi:hypothetical protein
MNNFVKYKHHVLAKNSEAYSLLIAAEKLTGKERELALRKLDKHLQDVDRRYQELLK